MNGIAVTLLMLAASVGQNREPVRVLVPAYFAIFPGDPARDGLTHWDRLIAAHRPRVSEMIAVVNVGWGFTADPAHARVDGGPLIRPDFDPGVTKARYLDVLTRAAAAGVGLVGYVSTDRGRRPPDHVRRDIRAWADWPGVTGVFLDEQAVGTPADVDAAARALPAYRALRQYMFSKSEKSSRITFQV